MGLRPLKIFQIISERESSLYSTSESDVSRRQILTYKDSPRTERVKRKVYHVSIMFKYHV